MNLLILIPCRYGSKGIPQKNFLPMCGVPLWGHTFDMAFAASNYIDHTDGNMTRLVISSDKPDMFPQHLSRFVVTRPDELSTDDSPVMDTINDALRQIETEDWRADAVCILQPTSPNRKIEDIISCVALYLEKNGKHPVVSGYLTRLKMKGKPDNKKSGKTFQRNGAVFIIPRALIDEGKILDGGEYEFEMPKSRSADIDDMDDWQAAEAIMEYRLRRGEK